MIVNSKIDLGVSILYDFMDNYFNGKKDYSKEVKELLNKLYEKVLEEVNNYEGDSNGLDIEECKYYYVEQTKNKNNKIELNWDCYILYSFIVHYISNKSGCYPKSVEDILKSLEYELLENLVISGDYLNEEKVECYFEEQIIYKEED